MKLYGIGTDIVNVDRVKKFLKNKKFLKKIFNQEKISKCTNKRYSVNCFAKRFAAKEAFVKALGTGISKGISFNEIIVSNRKSGKPFIKLTGKTKIITDKRFKKNKTKILLSLSDEKKYAVAFVTITL